MIKYIKRKLKRRAVKKKLLEIQNLYDFVDPGRLADINDCMFIFRNALKHPNSIYEIAPLTTHKIIENKKLGIFIILNNKTITVINHVCYYSNIPMTDRDWNKMINMFNYRVQKNRMEKIDQMKSQVEHSLSKLKNRMVQKIKPQV